jgi:hypothetical protein
MLATHQTLLQRFIPFHLRLSHRFFLAPGKHRAVVIAAFSWVRFVRM